MADADCIIIDVIITVVRGEEFLTGCSLTVVICAFRELQTFLKDVLICMGDRSSPVTHNTPFLTAVPFCSVPSYVHVLLRFAPAKDTELSAGGTDGPCGW